MDDLPALTPDELCARLGPAIARRLDATSTEDRARAGNDLLDVLVELHRRGSWPSDAQDAQRDGAAASAPSGTTALDTRPGR